MIMKSKSHQNKFLRIITMPIKALTKARDFYVRSMNNYADHMCYGSAGAMGGSAYADPMPRSFSTNSVRPRENDDDFKELLRAASTSTLGNRISLNSSVLSSTHASARKASGSSTSMSMLHEQQQQQKHLQNGLRMMDGSKGVYRSASVGMAIIEEDKACEFDDINSNVGDNGYAANSKKKFGVFPRSRSYAVGST